MFSQEKWAVYFSTNSNVANNPELVNFVKFCFATPAHNGNLKQGSLPSKERNRLSASSMKGILTTIYFENVSHKQFLSNVPGILVVSKKISLTENMLGHKCFSNMSCEQFLRHISGV